MFTTQIFNDVPDKSFPEIILGREAFLTTTDLFKVVIPSVYLAEGMQHQESTYIIHRLTRRNAKRKLNRLECYVDNIERYNNAPQIDTHRCIADIDANVDIAEAIFQKNERAFFPTYENVSDVWEKEYVLHLFRYFVSRFPNEQKLRDRLEQLNRFSIRAFFEKEGVIGKTNIQNKLSIRF
jgi:hypothetical protein